MKRTSVMLPESHWLALKEVAQREGRNPSELIREAVAAYVTDKRPTGRPSFVGTGSSGRSDVSSHPEEHLQDG